VIDRPNSILAQAGSGDILAGIIAGITSQGYETNDAVMESVRIFLSIAEKLSAGGLRSYVPEEFIHMIAVE